MESEFFPPQCSRKLDTESAPPRQTEGPAEARPPHNPIKDHQGHTTSVNENGDGKLAWPILGFPPSLLQAGPRE